VFLFFEQRMRHLGVRVFLLACHGPICEAYLNQESREGFVTCSLQDRSCQPPRVAELRPTLRTADAVTFLERAIAFFDSRGI
ncbi:MAG: hypothetical protein M3550_00165, partial [Actinomycetota bacterium]|nr:hypothetical protein [Actinomycetota bacterium]